jgi:raffinose/stachyose/melibiose transport system substrate-binding protein
MKIMKKKILKKTLALSVAAMMMLPTTALASETELAEFDSTVDTDIEGEITIYTYYADSSIATIDATIAKMNEKYPNLKFTIEHRADSDGTALKTWAAVGELPDIMNIPSSDTYDTLLENGDLYALDDAIAATNYYDYFINGDLYQQAHVEESDGKTYSYGNDVTNVFTVYYNKEVFEELGLTEPTNYEEFKNCIVTLKEAGKIPIALFGAEQWPGMAFYELACIAEGATSASNAVNDGEIKYEDDEAYLRAAEKLAEIAELGAF